MHVCAKFMIMLYVLYVCDNIVFNSVWIFIVVIHRWRKQGGHQGHVPPPLPEPLKPTYVNTCFQYYDCNNFGILSK
jgi:hypothetical protein